MASAQIILSIIWTILCQNSLTKQVTSSTRITNTASKCLYLTKFWPSESEVSYKLKVGRPQPGMFVGVSYRGDAQKIETVNTERGCAELNEQHSLLIHLHQLEGEEVDAKIEVLEPHSMIVFFLCNCNSLEMEQAKDVDFDIKILNGDESHHGCEERFILLCLLLFLIIYAILSWLGIKELKKKKILEAPILGVLASILTQLNGLFCYLIHHIFFYFNGRGVSFLEGLYRCWIVGSDSILIFTLALMMEGWGVRFLRISKSSDTSLAVFMATVILRYAYIIRGFITSDHHLVDHMYSGWVGHYELAISALGFVYFMIIYKKGFLTSRKTYREYEKYLLILGTSIMLIRPLMLFVARFGNEKDKHIVSICLQHVGHYFVCYYLMSIVCKKDSRFGKVERDKDN